MKNIWTLTVRTSLPDVCRNSDDLKTTIEIFEQFDDAKKRLREVLHDFAYTKNEMFDGDGHLYNLDIYTDERKYYEKDENERADEDSGWISSTILEKVHSYLREIFSGNATKISFPLEEYDDGLILIDVSNNSICISGINDGPINGVNPYVKTNMFDMSEEKDYMLYIDDLFGGLWDQDFSTELYIDLKKTTHKKKDGGN